MTDVDAQLQIDAAHAAIVASILSEFVPDREVRAFGSRVRGTTKRYADLDLAILGDAPLSLATLSDLKDAFADSDLPYRVDVVDWASASPDFRAIINERNVIVRQPSSHNSHGACD